MLKRTLVFAAAAAATAAVTAHAGHDGGVPARSGGHEGASFVRGQTTQFWRVRATDRRGRRMVAVTIWAAPRPHAWVEVYDPTYDAGYPGHSGYVSGARAVRRRGGVALVDQRGEVLVLRRSGRTWRLSATTAALDMRIRLAAIAAGARAGPWRLSRQEDGRRGVARWAAPAPLARARVRIRSEDGTTAFRAGRGYLDHTWGSLDLEQRAWLRWGVAQVWRGRRAFVVPMLSDRLEHSGAASRDVVTRAVLVKASPRGTSVCRARVAWWFPALYRRPIFRARCGGTKLVLEKDKRSGGRALALGGQHETYWTRQTEFARTASRPRGVGTFDHLFRRQCSHCF